MAHGLLAAYEDEDEPHVHLCVKARGIDNTRLNPRKADLANWRESFAQSLRDNGIDAVAMKRRNQLKRSKDMPQKLHNMKKRGIEPKNAVTAKTQIAAKKKAEENLRDVLQGYKDVSKALANSPLAEDRKLAVALIERLKEATKELDIYPAARKQNTLLKEGANVKIIDDRRE